MVAAVGACWGAEGPLVAAGTAVVTKEDIQAAAEVTVGTVAMLEVAAA